MNVVIVEDEKPAVKRLEKLLKAYDNEISVLVSLDSIQSAVKWFSGHPTPDLAFFDIQLADGMSFEIFEKVKIECPVIFTTAYDQYALKAFEVNSVDYLLKPINEEKLNKSLDKYHSLYAGREKPGIDAEMIKSLMSEIRPEIYKERFVVKYGDHLKTISVFNIRFFYSQDKATFFSTIDNKKYLVDFSLEQVETMVNPSSFFRINRKYIINIHSIQDIITFSNSRLKINMNQADDQDMIVAREKVQEFKQWLDK